MWRECGDRSRSDLVEGCLDWSGLAGMGVAWFKWAIFVWKCYGLNLVGWMSWLDWGWSLIRC